MTEEECDPILDIKMHWCDIIEQALECIVCLMVPRKKNIYICNNGHSICDFCKVQLTSCPTCQALFKNTRNLAVEELADKFHDMKSSLLDLNGNNQEVKPGTKSVATQTESLDEVESTESTKDSQSFLGVIEIENTDKE